jgi:hypothetical protein
MGAVCAWYNACCWVVFVIGVGDVMELLLNNGSSKQHSTMA